ncbi:MAG: PAS domain S-box protein, partial [Bacteroidota bacterium]
PADKKLVTVLTSFKLLKDDAGKPVHIINTTVDISERKVAELRLKESESRFQEVANSAPVMIWMSDENNITTYVNTTWEKFTGINTIGCNATTWEDLVHPQDVEECKRLAYAAEKGRRGYDIVYRLRTANGTYRWVKDVVVPRFLPNKKFVGFIGSVVDIEDQKKTEQQLHYQAAILENVTDVVVSSNLNFEVTAINKAAEITYGFTIAELAGKRLSEKIDFTMINCTLEECLATILATGFWEGEVSLTKPDGTIAYFIHTVKEFIYEGKKIGYLSIGKDITERRKMENALAKSEQFYRTLIAESQNATLLLDANGAITFASLAVKALLGYDAEEVEGKNAFDFINEEDASRAIESFYNEVAQAPVVKSITVRLKKKSGDWVWCLVRGHNMLTHPEIKSMVIYFQDDSVRKQAHDALQQSETRFRSLINELSLGIFLAEPTGVIVMCNEALIKMLGRTEDTITGSSVYQLLNLSIVDEQDKPIPHLHKIFAKTLAGKMTIKDWVLGIVHPVTNQRAWIMINAHQLLDEGGNMLHVIFSISDITSRRQMEQAGFDQKINHQKELTRASIEGQEKERQEIGKELHDNIGQQLTTVKLFLEMIKSTDNEGSEQMLSLSQKGVTTLINEVRALSRSLVPYSLKDLGLLDSLSELIDAINSTQTLTIKLCYAGIDDDTLEENQALTVFRIVQEQLNNICKHAAAKSGLVDIRLQNDEIIMTISDDGKGFNTKQLRKGVGFTNIANRAEMFGGAMAVTSQP